MKTHDDYLKVLYILQDQMHYWMIWRYDVSMYGIMHTLRCDCMKKLTAMFEREYRNYRAWCWRHNEDNLFISY